MASKMHALAKYGPRIVPGQPVSMDEFVEGMAKNSGQSEGEVMQNVRNFFITLRDFLKRGRSVHVDDIGLWAPHTGLDGLVDIDVRTDSDLTHEVRGDFKGHVENAENIGKSLADLVAMWNADPENADNLIPTS